MIQSRKQVAVINISDFSSRLCVYKEKKLVHENINGNLSSLKTHLSDLGRSLPSKAVCPIHLPIRHVYSSFSEFV